MTAPFCPNAHCNVCGACIPKDESLNQRVLAHIHPGEVGSDYDSDNKIRESAIVAKEREEKLVRRQCAN